MITVLAHTRMEHQRHWSDLMAQGLDRHGVAYVRKTVGEPVETDTVICWGWRVGAPLRAKGKEVLVAERGYVGDRFHWTSLGWNGLNGRADFRSAGKGPERWNAHYTMQDWVMRDGPTVIMGQVPGDAALFGVDYYGWLRETAEALPDAQFRPHPGAPTVKCGLPSIVGTLDDVLRVAGRVVVFNSNSATDAVLAGVPTVTFDQGAVTWDVTSHNLRAVVCLDRQQWANEIAWAQWSPDEIASGEAWEHIGR